MYATAPGVPFMVEIHWRWLALGVVIVFAMAKSDGHKRSGISVRVNNVT